MKRITLAHKPKTILEFTDHDTAKLIIDGHHTRDFSHDALYIIQNIDLSELCKKNKTEK